MAGFAILLSVLLSEPGPYALVNRAGAPLESLSIRSADSAGTWRPLSNAPLPVGARAAMPSPGGQLCAFDIRARIGGNDVTWSSVNLCDVRTVTLNRRPDGTLWVDYD